MDAALGCFLAILIAFHRIVVRIAGIDAPRLGLVAGVDAGVSVCALCPGHSARYDDHARGRNGGHRFRSAHVSATSV
jgi:hypothetical protein